MASEKKEAVKPCATKKRKGLWSPDEDERLYSHITNYGVGTWSSVAELAGIHGSSHIVMDEKLEHTMGEKSVNHDFRAQEEREELQA
ncbi:hypothetical protein EJB05_02003, partial [Eragrostis curvula]